MCLTTKEVAYISDAFDGTTHPYRRTSWTVSTRSVFLWKPHLEELICLRTVVDGGRWCVRWLIVAPLQLAETVDAVEVAGVQLGEVDVREVSVQAVRTHLLLPILKDGKREEERGKGHVSQTLRLKHNSLKVCSFFGMRQKCMSHFLKHECEHYSWKDARCDMGQICLCQSRLPLCSFMWLQKQIIALWIVTQAMKHGK